MIENNNLVVRDTNIVDMMVLMVSVMMVALKETNMVVMLVFIIMNLQLKVEFDYWCSWGKIREKLKNN